ncbi:MAG: hypothetical protein WC781_00005 [Candidatus Pacearchaeota archaeon]|jgi:hypothetical protein
MAEKCEICGEKIEETFLGKLNGTTVKVKKNTKTGLVYVCNSCQKEHGDKVKELANK